MKKLSKQELEDIALGLRFAINAPKFTSLPRAYLGMSQLGNPCMRYLWFYFHWADYSTHTSRIERIFRRGDLEEARIIHEFEKVGIQCLATQEELVDCQGHLRGHTDGRFVGVPGMEEIEVLGEFKTMAHKYFVPLVKKGVQISKPVYGAQADTYMHKSGLDYCLHYTTNKNDEDNYIEVMPVNNARGQEYIDKGEMVIQSEIPLRRVSDDPTYFECQWCEFFDQCHLGESFNRNCRTCTKSKPTDNFTWTCFKDGQEVIIDLDTQKKGCGDYDMLKV